MGRGSRQQTALAASAARREPVERLAFRDLPQAPLDDSFKDAVSAALADVDLRTLRLIGSRAYGTYHEKSDIDVRGIFQAPTVDLFRLRDPREQIDRDEPDLTAFELRRFVHMAAQGRPNVLEQLWAPALVETPAGELLDANRKLFLSRRIINTYGGYAQAQLRKALAGTGGSRGVKHFRREKFVLHLLRLFEQGTSLLETGDMSIRVADPDRLWQQARMPLEEVQAEFNRLDARFQYAGEHTDLPERPDEQALDEMLIELRLQQLERR